MNNYQSQQFWGSINSIIGFTASILVIGFMVGMVRPMGKFFEPARRPEKHLAKPIVKEVAVPGGSYWKCSTCGKELPPGTKVFKAGKEVYCSILCIKLPEHHSSNNKPEEIFYGRKLTKKRLESPRTFYHVTEKQKWERIQKEGLIPVPLNPEIQKATGLKEGIFLGGDEEVVDMMSMGLTEEAFEGYPELKEIILVTLEVIVPINTVLIEDPEFLGAEWPGGAWIIDRIIPVENIKFLERQRVKREEWE